MYFLHPLLLPSKENCTGSNTTYASLKIHKLVPSTLSALAFFSPGTKPHQCSFLLCGIRKSGMTIHNLTSSRLSIKCSSCLLLSPQKPLNLGRLVIASSDSTTETLLDLKLGHKRLSIFCPVVSKCSLS